MNSTTRKAKSGFASFFALSLNAARVFLLALCLTISGLSAAHARPNAVSQDTIDQLYQMVPDNGPMVVEFFDSSDPDTSGECRQQKPIFDKIAAAYSGRVTFVRIDISKVRDFAEAGRFTVCPSHLFLDQTKPEPDKIAKRHWGILSESDFKELLKEYFAVQ